MSLRRIVLKPVTRIGALLFVIMCCTGLVSAQETICATVKIEIRQEMTLERQAFDAEMKINNTTDSGKIENVSIEVRVTDENGTPIAITNDPNDLTAKFYIRNSNKENIDAIDGNGTVSPRTTAVINWLLIPAPGAAGDNPLGKKYLVGATLRYRFGGEDVVLEVTPDVITVKPLPMLTLDYFLTEDVEEAVPFTLGVRVKNNGHAAAKNLKIDSAQPRIIENEQGLLINFLLTGSYVDDMPVQNTLLINFGDIAPNTSKMGRWLMETTLSGKFTEFTVSFSHADELGGMLTSVLESTIPHFLIHDVRVDLPGRDYVRDFLARDGDFIRVYESDGPDSEVIDMSDVATLTASTGAGGNASYKLNFPPAGGFVYVRLPDPFKGTMAVGRIVRSDAKEMAAENVWLSKTRNRSTQQWEHWINFFDVNSTGIYDSEFQVSQPVAKQPLIQYIPDLVVKETENISFLVEASSQNGSEEVLLTAAPLPAGATLTKSATPLSSGARMIFDWTPPKGSAGLYSITYTAKDGVLTNERTASIRVEATGDDDDDPTPQPGPSTPTVESPLSGVHVKTLTPALSVRASSNAQDTTAEVQFEVYADEAKTQLVASDTVPKVAGSEGEAPSPTAWQISINLQDNTHYWWRARAFDGTLYSPWADAHFFVNTYNDPPDSFNLTSPAPGAVVSTLTPKLAWTNSFDKDGDIITYSVQVYDDEELSSLVAEMRDIAEDPGGTTSWTVNPALSDHTRYYWYVIAEDALGAQTSSSVRSFTPGVDNNTAPGAPVLLSPSIGAKSAHVNTALTVQNSIDAENDTLTYLFEIDTVNTFNSGNRRSSGMVPQGHANTSWTTPGLAENQRYWWRVKASDGQLVSDWSAVGNFLMKAINTPPPTPTIRNPGDGAWTATQYPTLEANPVEVSEGESVRYHFEVFSDAGLTQQVAEGISNNTALRLTTMLDDKTTYWWHVRAMNEDGMASGWSASAILYVSTGSYQEPVISMVSPVVHTMPDEVKGQPGGKRWQITLRWESTNPNAESTVALYWDSKNTGFAGQKIVDGLRQSSGTHSGSYVWDVTDFAPGAYYVYGVIYDAKGAGKAYAPGAVVIPPSGQMGSIVISDSNNLHTTDNGEQAVFSIRLGKAPTADVIIPLSSSNPGKGRVEPSSLTFTPQNWSVNQKVTVTGQKECAPSKGNDFEVLSGKAQSLDSDYIGLSGTPVKVKYPDTGSASSPNPSTNNPNLYICNLSVVSLNNPDSSTWEYAIRGELTNTGAALKGVSARLLGLPYGIKVIKERMEFGAVGRDETVRTEDTITLHSESPIPDILLQQSIGFHWELDIKP
ncbi:MAG: hypothetical protein FWG81_05990 [Betaproteobacteria bacterium]|nr:hypothetical protein [Betaproteobacteria bacterium]